MGTIKLFSDGVSTAPNPDPANFRILKITVIEKYVIATVHYPGCTTFQGKKVLLFQTTKEELLLRKILDPHFVEDDSTLIARFRGNRSGELKAVTFATLMLAYTLQRK
jgi:hypothetical protein